jgi:hypothetical protein
MWAETFECIQQRNEHNSILPGESNQGHPPPSHTPTCFKAREEPLRNEGRHPRETQIEAIKRKKNDSSTFFFE